MSQLISVLALPASSGTSIMGVIDIFSIANRIAAQVNETDEALFRLRIVSLDGEPVQCSNGYTLTVDASLAEIEPTEILYVTALAVATKRELAGAMQRCDPAVDWLRQQGSHQAFIATSCSGSFLLAEAGLLDDRQATTAWWLSKLFVRQYPRVKLDADAICTLSDNILCGAGTSSYQDVCLAIIERFTGKHFARLAAKYLMVDNQRRSQAPYAILSATAGSDDKVVNKAENWIRANLNQDFRIEDIAVAVAVSPRTLIRRFQTALEETPQSFTQKLRIEKCKMLLETTQMRFGEIVQRCGYNDESAFRRLFKRHCQLSPSDYRRRFNSAAAH
jgi:transcriptional regulator GlxA family with amidase domain